MPSGSADQRLDVEAAALAVPELREETGLLAGRLIPLGTLDVAPGLFSQRCRVFLATDLTHGGPQRELEVQAAMRSVWFTRATSNARPATCNWSDCPTISAFPRQLAKSLNWDQGNEMAEHPRFTIATGVQVFFCDPKSP